MDLSASFSLKALILLLALGCDMEYSNLVSELEFTFSGMVNERSIVCSFTKVASSDSGRPLYDK